MKKTTQLLPLERIQNHIYLIRKNKVILDSDLATLYDVETRVLIQAVKRNIERFPSDFMFQLSDQEFKILRSQSVISSWGGRRTNPYAFTEQGISMLSSVLKSKRAILMNIEIIRTFVQFRQMISDYEILGRKIFTLEKKYDQQFKTLFDAIHEINSPKNKVKKHPFGFGIKK